MNIFAPLFVLIIGLLVGSFLNVVILRWGTALPFWRGRSVCAHTGKVLPWYDLVPVFSFIALRGRSRFNGESLSMQYPFVELLTGLLFFGTYTVFAKENIFFFLDSISMLQFLITLAIVSVLIVIGVYDMRTKIIPDELSFTFAALSLVNIFLLYGTRIFSSDSLWHLAAGPILAFPFAFLWFVSRGTWMGFGDAKLSWGIGWFLGLVAGTSAIMLSFWIGAVIGILLILVGKVGSWLPVSKKLSLKSEIPFAPFLILGTLLVFLWNINAFAFF